MYIVEIENTANKHIRSIQRGIWQPLINIPLRSMLINAVVPLTDTRNNIEAECRLTYTSTGTRKLAPVDFDLLVSYHLTYRCGIVNKTMLIV